MSTIPVTDAVRARLAALDAANTLANAERKAYLSALFDQSGITGTVTGLELTPDGLAVTLDEPPISA